MKLSDYLSSAGITHAAFAEKIGATQAAVTRYVRGDRMPRREVMGRIAAATNGKVTANDFLDIPSPSQPQGDAA